MKLANKQNGCSQHRVRRRDLLKTLIFSTVGMALARFTAGQKLSATRNDVGLRSKERRVFIFQDTAHFDRTGRVETYRAPRAMASTRDYVNQTDQVIFLQRHWFA